MIIVHQDKCDLCGACVGVCPVDCIDLSETQLGIDNDICINCDHCVQICPLSALEAKKDEERI